MIDLFLSRERIEELRAGVESRDHRLVILADDDDPVLARVVMRGGDPDEFLSDVREALRDGEEGAEHYVVFEPVAIEPRPEPEAEGNGNDHAESVAGTDEIENFVEAGAHLTRSFLVLSVLSGVLASAALLRDSPAVLVGSMVIAPLFRPLALAGVAVLLGQPRRALRALAWLGLSLGLAAGAGLLVTWATPDRSVTGLIESRTGTSPFDLVVALAAGIAMAYAIVKKDSLTMVGIVVAASLMPVAAALGVTAAVGRPDLVGGALFTLASNVCGILLGLIVGLRVEELRASFRHADRARELTRQSLVVGSGLALLLLAIGVWTYIRGSGDARARNELLTAVAAQEGVAGALQLHDGMPVILVEGGAREDVEAWAAEYYPDLKVLFLPVEGSGEER
ncbi:MAG: DUF389 domain-containing protein [Phycisphaerales bacterium]|nr:DUF389 domain-containing protein [Phycisphaerales bacterium]